MSTADKVLNSIRLQRNKDCLAHSRGEIAIEQGEGQNSIASKSKWNCIRQYEVKET